MKVSLIQWAVIRIIIDAIKAKSISNLTNELSIIEKKNARTIIASIITIRSYLDMDRELTDTCVNCLQSLCNSNIDIDNPQIVSDINLAIANITTTIWNQEIFNELLIIYKIILTL
jgi:hypothetical protein